MLLVKMNSLGRIFCAYICFSVFSNAAHLNQLHKLELESAEDSNADLDTSRVLLNDESPTFFDRLLETIKLKRNSEPEGAESETKDVEVTDEDWLATMVKDFDKLVTALGEDVDFGLEEGSESVTKADQNKRQIKEAKTSKRASRGIKKVRNTNSRGHKMATDLRKQPRTRRNTFGTNKAGLVFKPNQGKGGKIFNRAGITKRETMESKFFHVPEHAARNIADSIVDTNAMQIQEPQVSLRHRRHPTVLSDNPSFMDTNHNEVQSSNKQNSEQFLTKKLESNQNGAINSQNHAPSLPLLSSNSETSNSQKESPLTNLSSKIPGIPNNVLPSEVRADGGISPTAVIGGFTMMLMPMPEMSLSNIQNMLQTGQQFSQVLPSLPSIPS